jgi:hypothetical protein
VPIITGSMVHFQQSFNLNCLNFTKRFQFDSTNFFIYLVNLSFNIINESFQTRTRCIHQKKHGKKERTALVYTTSADADSLAVKYGYYYSRLPIESRRETLRQ